jgi:hypothetical protein
LSSSLVPLKVHAKTQGSKGTYSKNKASDLTER